MLVSFSLPTLDRLRFARRGGTDGMFTLVLVRERAESDGNEDKEGTVPDEEDNGPDSDPDDAEPLILFYV